MCLQVIDMLHDIMQNRTEQERNSIMTLSFTNFVTFSKIVASVTSFSVHICKVIVICKGGSTAVSIFCGLGKINEGTHNAKCILNIQQW